MSIDISHLLETRISANHFDTSRQLGKAQITELVRLATLAPSAYHMQNWRFIAVQSPQAKATLQQLAFGQSKVAEAAVTFIVCGTLNGHERLPWALAPAIEQGVIPQAVADSWIRAATQAHAGNRQLQRDEALRSASLAAMTLIIAASGMGLASSAVGGFDPAGVGKAFDLTKHEIPVMLITVGHAAPGNWRQKPRLPPRHVLAYA